MNWKILEEKFDSTKMKNHIETQGLSIELTINKELENIKEVARKVKGYNKFIFSGCGDKYIVSLISEFLWKNVSEKYLDVIQSRILANYPPKWLDKNTCIVFLSQSGTTMDTLEACKTAMRKEANVICITNLKERKRNSLVELCENYKKGFVIKTHTKIYPETPLPSTGTFHTALASLNLLTLFINNGSDIFFDIQINHIPKIVDYLSNSKEVKKESMKMASKLKGFNNFYVVGDASRYGVARKHAKIMLMEGVKTNACDVESEEFIHSLIESLESKKQNPLILLKPLETWISSQMNYKIIRKLWLKYAGKGKLIELNPFMFLDAEVKKLFSGIEGDLLSPFLYTVLSEWQSFYLALAKNIDPGKAKLIKKVRGEEEIKKYLV